MYFRRQTVQENPRCAISRLEDSQDVLPTVLSAPSDLQVLSAYPVLLLEQGDKHWEFSHYLIC